MRELYAPFNRNHEHIMVMDVRSAELTKYAANAMLATKISFMNEMANIAERVGADIEQVRNGIGTDPRIGYHFIYPGAAMAARASPRTCGRWSSTARGWLRGAAAARGRGGQRAAEARAVREDRAHFGGRSGRQHVRASGALPSSPNTDDMREAPSRA